jgi:hypothetical protein
MEPPRWRVAIVSVDALLIRGNLDHVRLDSAMVFVFGVA